MVDFLFNLKNKIFQSRYSVVTTVFILFSSILILRVFVLQIVKGASYQENYNLKVEKTEAIEANRGRILDRNGNVIAYNDLAYSVTIEDSGTYTTSAEKNKALCKEIAAIIKGIEKNGDSLDYDFGIYLDDSNNYKFTYTGTSLNRFRADIFGHASIDDLEYNKRYKVDEANASADDIIKYLCTRYDIPDSYSKAMRFKIAMVRYKMSLNTYQKYISTVIASDVNDKTVAFIKENEGDFTGCTIAEKSVRKYDNAEAFSSIVGYTGKISTEEYEELSKDSDDYTITDVIGKAGIEQYMNEYLSGKKGYKTFYVDSLGNPISDPDVVEAESGDDVYLSIDKNLQIAAYNLLEQEIAGICYSKIVATKEYDASSNSDVVIPIYTVYYNLIANHLIDVDSLTADDATDLEKEVASEYDSKCKSVKSNLKKQLLSKNPVKYSDLSKEYQAYSTYIIKMLKSQGIFDSNKIDKKSETQKAWQNEELSVNEYLKYCIEEDWIDVSKYTNKSLYMDTDEAYELLVTYILKNCFSEQSFQDEVYKYAILDDTITGNQLCAILYDQEVLEEDESTRNALASGSYSAYAFIKNKLMSLELTPGQLALNPCSGSVVCIDSRDGSVLACVSYPGYDSNRLSNADSKYYSYLSLSLSTPLYNYATQQRTAPGSTFKIVSSTAGMSEGVISSSTTIKDEGIYENVSNTPKCWAYPSNHGVINVSGAIRDSCNYFFYEVGYRLAGSSSYSDSKGITRLNKYASMYGLDSKTGVEIEENKSKLATEYPVMAAIGQSDNNITTIALARYCASIANSGTVYNLTLLKKVEAENGDVIKKYSSSVKNKITVLDSSEWSAIHYGMKMMVDNYSGFNGFAIQVAGKTGTAQETKSKPNHALFIGYAPYDDPEIAIATRIAYGYTSHNAADLSKNIIGCYYELPESLALINGSASSVNSGSTRTD